MDIQLQDLLCTHCGHKLRRHFQVHSPTPRNKPGIRVGECLAEQAGYPDFESTWKCSCPTFQFPKPVETVEEPFVVRFEDPVDAKVSVGVANETEGSVSLEKSQVDYPGCSNCGHAYGAHIHFGSSVGIGFIIGDCTWIEIGHEVQVRECGCKDYEPITQDEPPTSTPPDVPPFPTFKEEAVFVVEKVIQTLLDLVSKGRSSAKIG